MKCILIFLVILTSGCRPDAKKTPGVMVSVIDSKSKPIQNALISVSAHSSGYGFETKTDINGVALLSISNPHLLSIEHNGITASKLMGSLKSNIIVFPDVSGARVGAERTMIRVMDAKHKPVEFDIYQVIGATERRISIGCHEAEMKRQDLQEPSRLRLYSNDWIISFSSSLIIDIESVSILLQ